MSKTRNPHGEAPNAVQVMEIRERAREQFPTNGTILAARASARISAQDKANRRRGASQAPARTSLNLRWGAFLRQTGRASLTTAQARSLRRRSTLKELYGLPAVALKALRVQL